MIRNFVAKNAQTTGAGQHASKKDKQRTRNAGKKELRSLKLNLE